MKKLKSLIFILIIIFEIFCNQKLSYSAFYDLEYPPNSTGKADYTDEDAIKQKNEESISSSEQYVGKSSNNYLKSLTIENATIEPEFNRQYVEYNLNLIDEKNTKIKIIAEAEDEKAKVEGAGEIELEDGVNNIRVVVIAENGAVQIYNLHIELPFKQSDLKINVLNIYGINKKNGEQKIEKLIPKFDSNIYTYSVNVEYDVTSLDIEAEYEPETFILKKGGDDLVVGKNEVYISVVDKNDEDKSTTYKIDVIRNESNNNKKLQIIKALVVMILLIIGVFIIVKLKNKKHK